MRALLLSAGLGTRLRPVTNTLPKCLVPINGKPLIDYWFEQLFQHGIERILVNTHYQAKQVIKHIEESEYKDFIDISYEEKLLNTAGTLKENKDYFDNKPLMLVHADNLSICNWSSFIASHQNRHENVVITMMTFDSDKPETCGIVSVDEKSIVVGFHEKKINPPSNRANAAVYIIEPSVLDDLDRIEKNEIDFSNDVIPRFMGRIGVYHNDIYHRDIGTLESYSLAQIESRQLDYKARYSLGLVILARNEEAGLATVYQRVKRLFIKRNIEHEIIIVNDGSVDRTREIAETISKDDPFTKVINHNNSLGMGCGYKEALHQTDKDYFMFLGGYDVHDDESLNSLFDTMGQADMTLFYFKNPEVRSLGRRIMSRAFTIMMNVITGLSHKYYNGMLLCRTRCLKKIKLRSNRYTFQAEAISKLQLHHNCSSVSLGFSVNERATKSTAFRVRTFVNVGKFFILLIYDLFIAPVNKLKTQRKRS